MWDASEMSRTSSPVVAADEDGEVADDLEPSGQGFRERGYEPGLADVRELVPEPVGARSFALGPVRRDDVDHGSRLGALRDLRQDAEDEPILARRDRLFRDSRGDLETMAKALGIKVSNVYHWLKRVGLDIRSLRQDS